MDNMSWESVLFTVGNCALLNRVLLREQNKTLWKTSSTFLGLKGIAECWRAIIYWIMPSTQLLSHVRLFAAPWTIIACQAPTSMGFSRQKYWNGLPLPTPEDLLHPGVESTSLTSPPLAAGFFTTRATWKAQIIPGWLVKKKLMVFPQGANHVYKCISWSLKVKVKSLSHFLLFGTIPWTVAYQALLSMGFSRQEYWSGLPFPSPGDLPNPGVEPGCSAL